MAIRLDAKRGPLFSMFCLLIVIVLLAVQAHAQVVGATVTGTVTDPSGAAIGDAQVSLTNTDTGITTDVTTNSAGFFTTPNLIPGPYQVTIRAAGFQTEIRSGITLTVGEKQVLNASLVLGQTSQAIEVSGEATTVELASSSISTVVNSDTVVELPLNGRDWTLLAALQPAVNTVLTQQPNGGTAHRGARGNGTQLTVSGTRPQTNNYRLDGISIVDYAGGSPGSVAGEAMGVDAIGEFSVITSNYDAEYGRTSGGVVNAITRSGTNQIHGDAYEFLRNSALDARNFFDGPTIPAFKRNQFGGSVGGPIQKDKTFFFADYEGLRSETGVTNVDKVPSQNARNGILSTGTVMVSPLVMPYLGFFPLPNAGLIGNGDTGHFDLATNWIETENFGTVRIDRKFSNNDSIFGTWSYDSALSELPDSFDDVNNGNTSGQDVIVLEETHVFSPSLVNSLRGGYNRVFSGDGQGLQAINSLASDTSLGSFPGKTAAGVSVPGLTTFMGGLGAVSYAQRIFDAYQVYDDAFLTKGTHSLKFGFAFERDQTNIEGAGSKSTGSFTFGSLADFLTNQPTTFQGAEPGVNNTHGLRQSIFGGYLQDDWRWRSNVTLNFGLRYEMATVPTEELNRLSDLLTFTSPTPFIGSPYFKNPTYRNFEPRIGFSWDPFRDGKTAIRGAFGVFDILPLELEFIQTVNNSAPFALNITAQNLPPGTFPTGAVAFAGNTPQTLAYSSIEQNPSRNYVMIWNLNVQRQLNASTSVTIGYVGNHGVHMLDLAEDNNIVLPTAATPQGFLWPTPIGSGTRLNPNVGEIRGRYWDGNAEYDALEVNVSKTMSHGFQVQGAYTWGKNIDDGSASTLGDPYTNSVSSLLPFCGSCRRGLSDFNIAQSLKVNYIWLVPTPKQMGAIGEHLIGGWEVGGILTLETGVPITPLIAGDPLGLNSSDPHDYPDRLPGPGCNSAVNPGNPNNYINLNCFGVPMATSSIAAQCVPFTAVPGSCQNLMGNAGRNSIIGPGLATFDFSLFKNNYIKKVSENFNVQFRAEIFNIFNKANFATPVDNETLFDATGAPVADAGAIDMTSTTSRQIQLALKLIW